ncbi:PTPLA-domain-containing protein [Ascodesmis nigricans]|uniref:Very-long-chain (3R)-3-hydroxyacyl-CoA dehydratase n=1 Tax=Ascodesmis nigricans TaxID=341454 RepID=A0A4S2N1Y6_9PEZI|nr:PTPLA-domain-containing protein [Ascodesmis nigricans]
MSGKPAKASARSSGSSLVTKYLILYNTISCILWLGVLGRVLLLLPLFHHSDIFSSVGEYTKWTQTVALLEIVHIVLRLVRSSLPTTVTQVASRILLVWGVCDRFQNAQVTWAYTTMLVAWSVTEVCRYSYYVVNLTRSTSGVLTWLRYNTFFILYPMGAGSEFLCIIAALQEAWSWDQRYYWFLCAILVTYPPGLFVQYTHMMAQRRKQIRGKKKAN